MIQNARISELRNADSIDLVLIVYLLKDKGKDSTFVNYHCIKKI